MRLMSALALAASTSLAASAGLVVPAAAKEQAAAKPQYSKAFNDAAVVMDKAYKAKKYPELKAAIDADSSKASTPDDQFLLNYYRYQLAAGTQDSALQKTAVEGMLASGKAPPEMLPQLQASAGGAALQAGNYEKAIPLLEGATADPKANPELRYYLAEAYFTKAVKTGGGRATPETQPLFAKGLASLQAAIDAQKAAGKPVPAGWYNRGVEVARVAGGADSQKWAMTGVQNASSPQGWNSVLRSYLTSHRTMTREETLDLFRLMAASNSLLDPSEYGEYADTATRLGLVGEAKATIDAGRAKGVVKAGQFADIYQSASASTAKDRASLPSLAASAAKSADGKSAAATANAYLGYGDYAKAAELFRTALQKGGVDANAVNLRLGIALARSGDKAGAKAAFDAVTATGVRKDLAGFWGTWMGANPA